MKKIFLLIGIIGIASLYSCTDLEEEILDESTDVTGDGGAESLLAPAYAPLPEFYRHTNYFTLQEVTTDEAILPYRGGTDWGDNGKFINLHQHTFTSTNGAVNDAWNSITTGLTYSTSAVARLRNANDPALSSFLAEARGLTAFYNMKSLDLYGIVFRKNGVDSTSVILRGEDAFNYIESELLDIVDDLSNDVGPGRISQDAAYGLLARLYLNAAVYRDVYGTPSFRNEDMDKVIDYTTRLIESGKYQLSPEFFEIFDDENHTNPELIFAIDQRADLNGHNRMAYFSLSGNQFPLPDYPRANGTDGAALTSDYYRTWIEAYGEDPQGIDPRFHKHNLDTTITCINGDAFEIDRGILRGQQYGLQHDAKGEPFERCDDGGYVVGKIYNVTRSEPDEPVIFTENIDFSLEGSDYATGYRVEKYEFSKQSDTGRNRGEADLVVLRLADMYLMRAEAYLRRSNNTAAALEDVNTIRGARTARFTAPDLNSIDLETLYRERGFELYWEHQRRTDMIRFGKYEDTWTEKNNSDVTKRLFPIPQSAIDAASDRPGYLVQNEGY
ncbi:RagB/SusD family nutrient uptake outer membrane protein [Fulvivirga maritima]|uniref:RagB/SusD family nutrient uptake outer membrane protein n=1 Tax=Fulvivirga maritima TaxID=2904247 RepID=UPI001F2DAE41|nr:RagB/SusD family nutrient uptake outer membrane protein [Fulvivirga maritima]UII28724.1 RagB/SusD family nutrient uptake outer membrane protein [Fulvivirga maritima]